MMIPLCLLELLRASHLAPGAGWVLSALGASVELAVIGYVVIRVRRGWRGADREHDILKRLRGAALALMRSRIASEIAATELAVFYYAFFSWGARPHIPAGAQAFTLHRRSGIATLFGIFAGIGVIETALVHLMMAMWSAAAAWALTALSVYGIVWLTAVARSFRLRPALVSPDELEIRSGLMLTLRVPLSEIAEVRSGNIARGSVRMKLPPGGDANILLRFKEPVIAVAMYGIRRRVSEVALSVDDPGGFAAALIETMP